MSEYTQTKLFIFHSSNVLTSFGALTLLFRTAAERVCQVREVLYISRSGAPLPSDPVLDQLFFIKIHKASPEGDALFLVFYVFNVESKSYVV